MTTELKSVVEIETREVLAMWVVRCQGERKFRGASEVVVGRDPQRCDLVFRDKRVSRVHCVIRLSGESPEVVNLSKAGTYVDGRLVKDVAQCRARGSAVRLLSTRHRLDVVRARPGKQCGRALVRIDNKCFSDESTVLKVASCRCDVGTARLDVVTWNVGPSPNLDSCRNLDAIAKCINDAFLTARARNAAFVCALQELDKGDHLAPALRPPEQLRRLLSSDLRWLDVAAGRRKSNQLVVAGATVDKVGSCCLGGRNAPLVFAQLRLADDHAGTVVVGSAHLDANAEFHAETRTQLFKWLKAQGLRPDVEVAMVAADFNADLRRCTKGGLRFLSSAIDKKGWAWGSFHGYHRTSRTWKTQDHIIDGLLAFDPAHDEADALCRPLNAELLLVPDGLHDIDPHDHDSLATALRRLPADHFPVRTQLDLALPSLAPLDAAEAPASAYL